MREGSEGAALPGCLEALIQSIAISEQELNATNYMAEEAGYISYPDASGPTRRPPPPPQSVAQR